MNLQNLYSIADRFILPSSLVRMMDSDYWRWDESEQRYISANDIITAHGSRRYAGKPVRAGVDEMLKLPHFRERHTVQCRYNTCNGQYTSITPSHIYCDKCIHARHRNNPLPDTRHIDSAIDSFLYNR